LIGQFITGYLARCAAQLLVTNNELLIGQFITGYLARCAAQLLVTNNELLIGQFITGYLARCAAQLLVTNNELLSYVVTEQTVIFFCYAIIFDLVIMLSLQY
jgi:hypothetical protein